MAQPRWSNIWQRLTEPAPSVTNSQDCHTARLLASLLVTLLPLGLFVAVLPAFLNPTVRPNWKNEFVVLACGTVVWGVAYGLTRTRRPSFAAMFTLAISAAIITAVVLTDEDPTDLVYLIMPVLIGTTVLSTRQMAVFLTANIGVVLLLPAFKPDWTYDQYLHGPALVTGVGFALTMWMTRYRDRLAEERQAQLVEREARYRGLLEAAFEGMAVYDDNRLLDVSPGLARMFGYSHEQIEQIPIQDLVRGEAQQLLASRINTRPEQPLETDGVRRDGTPFPIEIIVKNHTVQGQAVRVVAVRDISGRKQAEEALRQTAAELKERNDELDKFAHTVAHDLKNPLAHIIGYAETLRQYHGTFSAEETDHALSTIVRSGHKMNDIVDGLLQLASIPQTDGIPSLPVDMARVIRDVLERLAPMIAEEKAEITVPNGWPVIRSYSPWIEEIWANYITNAIKYGGVPPHIELGATDEPGFIRFWVRDNGLGLTQEQLARIFEPFIRLNKGKSGGYGLGLSIVQRIADKLGGRAGADSEPGEGSTFHFTLPTAQHPEPWATPD